MDELFSKDPLELTQEDISAGVAALREARKLFSQEEAKAKTAGKRTSTKAGLKGPPPKLTDLDLKFD